MPLVIPEGFGLLSIKMTTPTAAGDMYVTCGVELSDLAPTLAQEAFECAWQFMLAFEASFDNRLANEIEVVQSTCTVVDGDGVMGSATYDVGFTGSRSGTDEPWAMAAILRKSTTRLGRPGRGRMFVPGILSDDEVAGSGIIDSTAQDNISARGISLLGYMGDPSTNVPPGGWVGPGSEAPRPLVLLHSDSALSPDSIFRMECAEKVGWVRGRLR